MDYFGVDLGISRGGTLLFEANASMSIFKRTYNDADGVADYANELRGRVSKSLKDLLFTPEKWSAEVNFEKSVREITGNDNA